MSDDASRFKDRGNVFFKAGQLKRAVEMYKKAEEADPHDPVYASNLSAALYEVGDYAGCMKAVLRSWRLLRSHPSPKTDLVVRLSTRLAKAICNGARSGGISPALLKEHSQAIHHLEEATVDLPSTSSNAASYAELVRVWQEWRQLESQLRSTITPGEALAKFSELPVLTPPLDPALEFYSIGQDEVMNVLSGWGPRDAYPLKLDELHPSRLSDIAILFGGVGDARHVYGSLIGFHRAYHSLSKSKRSKLRVHMTLLDIHPGMLARDLCILMLVNQLMQRKLTSTERIEIKATIMYTFAGVVMPAYSFERLQRVIRDLKIRLSEKPARMPSWLYVVSESIPGIIAALDYWANLTNKPASRTLEVHSYVNPGDSSEEIMSVPGMANGFRDLIGGRKDSQRTVLSAMLKTMPDRELMNAPFVPPGVSVEEARSFVTEHHDTIVDFMIKNFDKAEDCYLEQKWYKGTKVFLPPPELMERHPGFEAHSQLHSKDKLSKAARSKIASHIHNTWKTNVTLFDDGFNNNPYWCPSGWPDLEIDAFAPVRMLEEFNERLRLGHVRDVSRVDTRAYTACSTMFESVAEALAGLEGRIKLEVLCGGVTEELEKMRYKADRARPVDFPRLFTRIWLSNVPDYTHGTMNMAVYVVPNLQCEPEAAVACNCLLNMGAWNSDDEFCHTYTLLHPNDIHRYLGCRVVRKNAIMEVLILSPNSLPRPLSELATREELTIWLTRVLLNTINPGRSKNPPYKIRLPNNLVAYFGLLLHLHRIGFPGHWLSDFLRGILSGSLVTDIDSYHGYYPIPLSEIDRRVQRRRLRLDPWLAELETIIAVANEGIPFSVSLPPDCARSASDVGVYEALVKPARIFSNSSYYDTSPFDPVTHLLFYKPTAGSAANLAAAIPSILEGKSGPPPGQFFIVTAPESVQYQERITWRMSKERVHKMQEEKWEMAAYRIDTYETATVPVVASKWKYLGM